MAQYLLLAEKPSVMRDIHDVYTKYQNEYEFQLGFDSFHGHLMELAQPADYNPRLKRWSLDTLPILPESFHYVESDPESCRRIMDRIQSGYYAALINACDAGREGEHIFYSFYEAHNLTLNVLRFWASDTTEQTIRKALHQLQPASRFDGLRQSAKLRAQLDWLSGINFSRAISLKTNKKANIGRVVSPTLKMIADREREIRKFVSKDFFEVQAAFQTGAGAYMGTYLLPPDYKKTRFDTKQEAGTVLESLRTTGVVREVHSKKRSIKAPTLYSITELQKDGSKYFGYGADRTEALAQALYEKHLTSYPRTESRFLPTAMIPELPAHLKPLLATPLKEYVRTVTKERIAAVTRTKEYIDNAGITDHHAIIPTTESCRDFGALSRDEQNIYLLICKRFLSIFMDPYVVEHTVIITDVGGSLFKTTGKVELSKGYGVLYTSKARDVVLPPVRQGEPVEVTDRRIREGKTTPPDRYNTATLLDAMKNAGNLLSSEESRRILRETAGLGTGATRKDILKKLETTGMCSVKKTVFIPTDFGMALADVIGNREIASPQMTADWEARLQAVEHGSYRGDLGQDIRQFVAEETRDIIQQTEVNLEQYEHVSLGRCPKCGGAVLSGKNFYYCANYKKSCDFLVRKVLIGAKLTEDDMKHLLSGKKTRKKKMKTKSGKQLTDSFVLDGAGQVVPAFALQGGERRAAEEPVPAAAEDRRSLGVCPVCGGQIFEGQSCYLCSNRESTGCSWSLGKKIRAAEITPMDVEAMLKGETSAVHQFTWSSGRKGVAKLKLNGGKLEFLFPENK